MSERVKSFEDFEFAVIQHGYAIVCLNHYWQNDELHTFCTILNTKTNKAFKAEGTDSSKVFNELYVKMIDGE